MSNFSRSIKKHSLQEQLEKRIAALEMFEARATMVLAIYDALAGEIEADLVKFVSDELGKSKSTGGKMEFYAAAKALATCWIQDKAMEEQEAALKPATVQNTPDMSANGAED